MNKDEKVKLCDTANRIKKLLEQGNYKISKYITNYGTDALFLHKVGKYPSEGVYIQSL